MHVLITGGRGQLGRAVADAFGEDGGADLTLWNRPEYDISDPAIGDRLCALDPDLVVNAAAWTNVDGAEEQPGSAYAVNALGANYLADGCRRCGAEMVHISTNEVFEGKAGCFYREYDAPNAGSTYARSKLAGEVAAQSVLPHLYIVRVAWLYGAGESNFPSKISQAAAKHSSLRVVDDEFGNPTYAPDVAKALVDLVQTRRYGIYHIVNDGYASRYAWAQTLFELSGQQIDMTPIPSSEWPRPTLPPSHAVLVNQAAAALGIRLRPWQEALAEYIQESRLKRQ